MAHKTEQEEFWAGDFGCEYIERNNSEKFFYSKVSLWSRMLRGAFGVESVLEFGCNIGLNLVALKKLKPSLTLSGYELNPQAAKLASEKHVGHIIQGSIIEEINDVKADLTFTAGVLIHINPDYLSQVYKNLVTASNRYIIIAEYYNPQPVMISYRGHQNRLFKRDFAGELMDDFNCKLIDYGFVYRRDNWAAQDDLTWFLLEK